MKLLLVDDEPLMLELLKSLMHSLNHEVLATATNGEEALECLRDNPTLDVIISDINMPVMDGWELVTRVRDQGLRIPVILVTGLQNHLSDPRIQRLEVLRVISKVDDFMCRLDAALKECEEKWFSPSLARS